jgi:hypothetical protein
MFVPPKAGLARDRGGRGKRDEEWVNGARDVMSRS